MRVKIYLRTIAVIILCLAVIAVITACGGAAAKINIDISEIVTVKVIGTDGLGSVNIGINTKPFDSIAEDKDDKTKAKYVQFLASISSIANKDENIKNGDEIIVTSTYSKDLAAELGFNVSNTETRITAEGLETATEIKIADLIRIDTSGDEVVIYRDYSKVSYEASSYIRLERDNGDNLALEYHISDVHNGDTIKLIAKVPQESVKYLTELGYVLAETEATFTVEGLSEYVTDISRLTTEQSDLLAEEALKSATEKLESYVVAKYSWTKNYIGTKAVEAMKTFYGSKLSDPCVMGINKVELNSQYLAQSAGDGKSDFKNVIFYVFDVDMVISEYTLKDIEASGVMVLWLADVQIDNDGNAVFDKWNIDSFYKTAEEALDGLKDKYDGKYVFSE